jgi:hypothetical protein
VVASTISFMRPQLSRAAAVISSSETPASAARSTPLLTLSELRAIATTAFWLSAWTARTRPSISLVPAKTRCARAFISPATTAKARPCSPAWAAMIDALSASSPV